MTGHQINSLVGDLVAMAQAMERLPICEGELSEARQEIHAKADTIQRLELKLMDAHNLESELRQSIRDLEVARDDAELRFLEAEEHGHKALDLARSAKAALALIEPLLGPSPEPKPEPVAEPVLEHSNIPVIDDGSYTDDPRLGTPTISEVKPIAVDPTYAVGQSAPVPNTTTSPSANDAIGDGIKANDESSSSPQGQSEPDPTDATEHTGSIPDALQAAVSTSADTLPTPAPADPTGTGTESEVLGSDKPQSYLGKRYKDVVGYIRHDDWINGGGTDHDYWY